MNKISEIESKTNESEQMMSGECIYCGHIGEMSESHIIPHCITLAQTTNYNVCRNCNTKDSNDFETQFSGDFAYIRNELGYKLRRKNGKPVPYRGRIYIKIADNFVVLRETSNIVTIKGLWDEITEKDVNGNIIGMKNVDKKFMGIKNPIINIEVLIDHNQLFLSKTTIKTVSKIAYEWHCKRNKVSGVKDKYKDLINFIKNDIQLELVRIINDDFFVNDMTNILGYIPGSHALIEYEKSGFRYIAFTLFGIVWYEVKVCAAFLPASYLEEIEQYSLDKRIRRKTSDAIAVDIFSGSGIEGTKTKFFHKPSTIGILEVTNAVSDGWKIRLEELFQCVAMTKEGIPRLIELVEADDYYNKQEDYYQELFYFREGKKILILLLLSIVAKIGYDDSVSFYENLKVWNTEYMIISVDTDFWFSSIKKDKLQGFKQAIFEGIKLIKGKL